MIQIKLNDEQRQSLHLSARQEVGRVSERIHFVCLSDTGYSPPQIGALLGYDEATVRHWLKQFQPGLDSDGLEQALANLRDQPRSGRPRQTTPEEDATIQEVLQADPAESGNQAGFWTLPMLKTQLRDLEQIDLSLSSLRRRLHELKFAWRRPRVAPAEKTDPETASKLAKIEEVTAQADDDTHVLYQDETTVRLLPIIVAMWQLIGQQVRIPAPPNWNRYFNVFGALNVHTGQFSYQFRATKKKEDFIAFLEHLLTVYPTGMLYLIIDGAPAHRAIIVREWLAIHSRIQLIPLPTYRPHLNPVERIWKQLKRHAAANRAHADLGKLKEAVQTYLNGLTLRQALQTAGLAP